MEAQHYAKPKPKNRRKRKATRELSAEQKRSKRARHKANRVNRFLASGAFLKNLSLHDVVLELERDRVRTGEILSTKISELSTRLLDGKGERGRIMKEIRRLVRGARPPVRAVSISQKKG